MQPGIATKLVVERLDMQTKYDMGNKSNAKMTGDRK